MAWEQPVKATTVNHGGLSIEVKLDRNKGGVFFAKVHGAEIRADTQAEIVRKVERAIDVGGNTIKWWPVMMAGVSSYKKGDLDLKISRGFVGETLDGTVVTSGWPASGVAVNIEGFKTASEENHSLLTAARDGAVICESPMYTNTRIIAPYSREGWANLVRLKACLEALGDDVLRAIKHTEGLDDLAFIGQKLHDLLQDIGVLPLEEESDG